MLVFKETLNDPLYIPIYLFVWEEAFSKCLSKKHTVDVFNILNSKIQYFVNKSFLSGLIKAMHIYTLQIPIVQKKMLAWNISLNYSISLWKCNDFLCSFLFIDEQSKALSQTHFYPMGDWLYCLCDRARLYKWNRWYFSVCFLMVLFSS